MAADAVRPNQLKWHSLFNRGPCGWTYWTMVLVYCKRPHPRPAWVLRSCNFAPNLSVRV